MSQSQPSPPQRLLASFETRDDLVAYVQSISPWLKQTPPSPYAGGKLAGHLRLQDIKPSRYARTRNYLAGHVTFLSPYIRHGVISLSDARDVALTKVSQPKEAEKFIQELAWRDFWQRIYVAHPDWIWDDIEEYKTGWQAEDYAANLPEDIRRGQTGVACIDQFIQTLLNTGYLHNHARMYVAAYVVHWRRIRWQAGAKWFLHHLLDGDPASNNLSWQWVASTFSRKPYIFNLDNVKKYTDNTIDTSAENNQVLHASYDSLTQTLFPNQART